MTAIRKVTVLGAGVMGANIAAHVANAGVPVILLDIVPKDGANRNAIAEGAIDRLLKADPAPLMHRANARLITPGNTEDHLALLGDCDWIIEAVIERLDIKQSLYRKIDAVRKPGSIVASNTSTIPLATLIEGMPDAFARDFLITHFFNPPRYMRLLELVAGPQTRRDAAEAVRVFADVALGKTVVDCKDTPGFIGNRIGIFWLQCSVVEAMNRGLAIEEADAAIGRPAGIPKTGVFGLLDMVGLDLMPHVLGSMAASLPQSDPFHAVFREPTLIRKMVADGYTGRKGKGGFYRLEMRDGRRVKQALDLKTGEYRDAIKPKLKSVTSGGRDLRTLLSHSDRGGRYAWAVISQTLSYAASLVPEIADDIVAVDTAMRLGYNWRYGPFELIDKIGAGWFAERLRAEGRPVPKLLAMAGERRFYRIEAGRTRYLGVDGVYRDIPRVPGVLLLSDIKLRGEPIVRNGAASLWDIGDGVACLEFHSKMNSLDPRSLAMIRKAIEIVPRRHKALVIYNEGRNFSVGANIGLLLYTAMFRAWFIVRALVRKGQETYKQLKHAPFPVVGAPSGMALGGGCEVLLHCSAVQAHAESYVGLVEAGVGIIPAWGGCKEMLLRWSASVKRPGGPIPPVAKAFETIGMAAIAKSAAEAKDLLFFRPNDGITMNRDRLLADAKAKALALVENYAPPAAQRISLPGESGRIALRLAIDGLRRLGKATPHDAVVGEALAGVLSGGETDITATLGEDDLLALERGGFMTLVRHPATRARIGHMLRTGKPLRN
ncbi:MAG: 3-hydroxyacyl-CoA dehydrogenase [Rhodospirillales bacterium]|nr:3-hydroxyacyl-CoA dehydrogenase [Rhodospirillales bacterium]